ncbi:MAG TPA: TetR/AcrR family transcriptional regulator [Solirubrobacteraceae bacterium]|jgi:AcrR family transcriptional regulator
MIQAVAERGYMAVTTRELVGLAGVSKRTLYDLFAGKEECFLAAFDLVVDRAVRRIATAYEGGSDWRARLCGAFDVFTRELDRDPCASRLVLVEALGAGPTSLARMEQANARFEAMVSTSLAQAPGNVPVAPILVEGIVAGLARVARVRLLDGRAGELPELASQLLDWALCYRCKSVVRLERVTRMPLPSRGVPADAADMLGSGTREDSRARIMRAGLELAARDGYGAATLEAIVSRARVSRRVFVQQFDDPQTCFLAAFELLGEQALALAFDAGRDAADWPGGVYRTVAALTERLARDEMFARATFIEIFALGPAGLPSRERLVERLAENLVAAVAPRPGRRQAPSELVLQASAGAVWGIVHRHVAQARARQLPVLAGHLTYMLLAPLLGPKRAVDAILDEHARMLVGASQSDG